MSKFTWFKVAQVVGAVCMAAGVASCQLRADNYTPMLFLIGAVLYGGGRLAAWFSSR